MPIGTILQRCRSLIYLNFTLDRSELGGATMFAWAAHEAKEREAGRLLAPPVALEELRLSVDSRYGVGVPRILMDAMHGFALTLYSLYVDCTFFDMEDFGEDHDEDDKNDDEEGMSLLSKPDDAPIVMHKLNSFVFESHDNKLLDTRLFQFCPRLTSLSLMLFGRATTLFDEASFHGMRRLQTIILDDTTGNMIFAADSPGFLDFWTWDWHLPELTYFKASLVSSKTKFNFRMLRCFPKLAKLCLDFRTLENMPPHQTELLSVLPNVAGDNFPALEILEMSGSYILHEEDLRFLMGPAFSSLREFSMEIPGSCTVGHVLAHTRDHPSLENVKFLNRDNFPDEAMQKQLGLTLYDSDGGGASADRSCSYTFEIDDYKSATYILK
ncbi:hypothetical protein BGZ73_004940 [Actinomortierella ambigua]|nr:hypothetical protein BGZ73_004940 [Actinomortierella ambigua]